MITTGQNLRSMRAVARHVQAGFSTTELLVSLAILGVLAALAGPNFSASLQRYRVNAMRDDLVSAIQVARTEAIRRGARISVARTTGCGVTLVGNDDWSCGWEVFLDRNANGTRDANGNATLDDTLLQQSSVLTGYSVMHTGKGVSLAANVWGQITDGNGAGGWQKFVLTPPSGVGSPATTTVCINSGGRIRIQLNDVTC